MPTYELLLLIHILLFVYWLGGDLGVFYSSGFVVNDSLSREARLTAAKIMLGCDLVPRICMSLMLTVGGLLSASMGFEHITWQLWLIVLLGPFWLSMVLVLHFKHHASFIPALTTFDFYFRWLVIASIIASCAYALSVERFSGNSWLIAKLLGFAFLVFCGLMIRIQFKGFVATYSKLMMGHEIAKVDNQVMKASLNRVRPWVVTIWIVLLIEALLGVFKPNLF